MKKLPTLFVSHGSPMLAIERTAAHAFLAGLGKALPRPTAILLVSAHWETVGEVAVSVATQPETIHDFAGFSPALYEIQYAAPGAPAAALRAAAALEQAGLPVRTSATRGLDHGAWVPLRLMYPAADIPVAQVSVMRGASPAEHLRLGAALRSLREQGVLVIGSGSLTHNLYEFRGHDVDASVPPWVSEFGDWMKERIEAGDHAALLDYRKAAPHAVRNHPTEEHLLPLFVAKGAASEGAVGRRLHASVEYGVLAMDVYAFE
jgi:4,5-DOPA dioxygenase extradiol